jgi:hypothetical protein
MMLGLFESLIKIECSHIHATDRIDPIRGIFDIFSYILHKIFKIVNQAADRIDSIRGINMRIFHLNQAFRETQDHKDRLRFDQDMMKYI